MSLATFRRSVRVALIAFVVAIPAIALLESPTARAQIISSQITIAANSDIVTANPSTPITFSANQLFLMSCKLWLVGGDSAQHVWWRVRVDTTGVGPGYFISTQEVFQWVHFEPVWITVDGHAGSSAGQGWLQIANSDSAQQTFGYWCQGFSYGGTRTPSSVTSTSGCADVGAGVTQQLYAGASLAASTLYTGQFGFTVDPSSPTEEIHSWVEAYLWKSNSDPAGVPYTAAVSRNLVYWERAPSTGRLPVDISVFGLTLNSGGFLQLKAHNADSVTHNFCWTADVISSGTATRTTVLNTGGTVPIGANSRTTVYTLGLDVCSGCTRVYSFYADVGFGSPDQTQYVNWMIETTDSAGNAKGAVAQSLYQWWNYRSSRDTGIWRVEGGGETMNLRIGNWDSASQTFSWEALAYYFLA